MITRLLSDCLDLLLPPGCRVCGDRLPRQQGSFCPRCREGFSYLVPPYCRSCGAELVDAAGENPLCGDCLASPPPFALARSVLHYRTEAQQLIHRLKFGGDLSVLSGVAELIRPFAMSEFAEVDQVVVVPLHPRRLRQRGFNQAMVLARLFFADRLTRIRPDWLVRLHNTPPQSQLDRSTRRNNLRGAFQVKDSARFIRATVGLIDDVYTTGATVRECSKVILAAGAHEVRVLTLARVAPPHRGRMR